MKAALFTATVIAGLWAATGAAQQDAAVEKTAGGSGGFHVVVELDDGSRLVGMMPADFTFPIQSSELKANVAIKRVRSITMSRDHKSAVIIMQNDDRIKGTLAMQSLPLKMMIGDVQLDPLHINAVRVFATDEAAADGLVFWNTLANETEAFHSAVGPNLVAYVNEGNPKGPAASREFIEGKRGGAITIKGTYKSEDSVRNLVLGGLDKLINPEKGCIELWYFQVARPVGYSYGVYRLFDGDYGLDSPVQFCAVPYGIEFALVCSTQQQQQGVNFPIEKIPEREWVHLAAVWNRKGIEGSADTIRIYLNGKVVATSTGTAWGTNASGKADICGANDDQCAGKYYMNNLKVWNYDRTNFDLSKKPDIVPKDMPPAIPPAPEDPDADLVK